MPTTIAQDWASFDDAHRQQLLARMTPDQKSQLRQELQGQGATPPADAPPGPWSRLLSSAWDPIKGAVQGAYQAATAPPQGTAETVTNLLGPGALLLKRSIVDPAIDQGKQAVSSTKEALAAQNHYSAASAASEAAGHALATVLPVVGPWAASFGQKIGEQIGSGDYAGAAGTVAGNATLAAAPEVAKRVVPPLLRRGSEMISGTGPNVAADLAKTTAADNTAAAAKAVADQAKQDAARSQELQDFYAKTHPQPATSLETGRPRTAEELQSHKQALDRGLERLDSEFQSDLTDTQERVRQQAGAKYDAVRAKVGGAVAPEGALADAVRNAEKNISGSKERIGVFQDILRQHPESSPDFMDYQGAKIPQGHPLYDVLNEQGANAGAPTTFSDLQGYYSELGSKLAKGGMADDVFRAVRDLHSDIGSMMQRMADDAGAGADFADARKFYRGYMETFRDSSTPIYKAINAAEKGQAVAALAGKDVTGIEALAKYDPQLARRGNTLRNYQAEANSIPQGRTAPYKPPPQLSPKPTPVQADVQTITPEDVAQAKADALENRSGQISRRGAWMSAWPLYHVFSAIVGGAPAEIGTMGMESGATLVGTQAVAKLLQNPHAVEFLTKATPRDVAAIPPELRSGNWQPIIDAAKRKGLVVSPYVAALAATARPQHPTLSPASPVQ